MRKTGEDNAQASDEHTRGEHYGEFSNCSDVPIEQHHKQQRKYCGDETHSPGGKQG